MCKVDGTLTLNTEGLECTFTPEQEEMFLVHILMEHLGRGFLNGKLTNGRDMMEHLRQNALRYLERWGREQALIEGSEQLSDPGKQMFLPKSDINVTDLAALTAATGDEFALFTLKETRMVVRGNYKGIQITNFLSELQSENWRWSAHTHPGTSDSILNASGIPGDRQVLQLLRQERSLILNSAGRRNVFDMKDDVHISNKVADDISKKTLRGPND